METPTHILLQLYPINSQQSLQRGATAACLRVYAHRFKYVVKSELWPTLGGVCVLLTTRETCCEKNAQVTEEKRKIVPQLLSAFLTSLFFVVFRASSSDEIGRHLPPPSLHYLNTHNPLLCLG